MGKAIKILLSFLGLLMLLMISAVVVLPILIDPNDFKPQIIELIHEHTGRTLTIEGDLKLSFFPGLSIETKQAHLSNRAGFNKTRPFARIAQIELKINLIPLLSQRLEVDKIWLKGLRLNLETNAHGMNNWDDFAHIEEPKPTEVTQTAEKTNTTTSFNPANIRINHAAIEDAQIIWNNQATHQRITLDPLKLQISNIRLGSPIDFQMDVTLESQQPEVKEIMTVAAKIMVNKTLNQVNFEDMHIDTHTEGKIIADTKIKATITLSSLNLDLSHERIKLKPVSINIDAQIAGNRIPGNHQTINLSTNTDFNLAQQTLSLSEFKLNAGELKITGNMTGKRILDTPELKGQVHLSNLNPKKLMKQWGLDIPETKDVSVLTRLAGQFNFNGNLNQATLNDIVILLDDSHLSGTAQVKHFQQPAIRFDLALDQIDIDRYLKPAEKTTHESLRQPVASMLDNAQMLTLEPLRHPGLQGTINIKQLTISGMSSQNIKVEIQ